MRYLDPTRIALPSGDESVRRFLTYADRSVDYQIKKLRDMIWWRRKDPSGFEARLEELKAQKQQCLLMHDDTGQAYTYSGLWPDLAQRFRWAPPVSPPPPDVVPKSMPWDVQPKVPRDYQVEAVEALEASRHGAIELPTGCGKSLVIMMLCKSNAVKTVIMTPSSAIADQMYHLFSEHFGQRWVGKYGDGAKKIDKLFTVAVAQALARVEPGTEAWEGLSQANQFIVDESHVIPAETFNKVNMGLLKGAYWRYYVSATQLRTDGAEMLLKGIIGPVVYRRTFRELVEAGWLAEPRFKIFRVQPNGQSSQRDPNDETRQHLFLNPSVHKLTADIAHKMVAGGKQIVILIEEFRQFDMLKNYLSIPFEFVHGGTSKEARQYLPQQYWKCDVKESVANFNEGRTRCLIGTSAISTGVDIVPVDCLVYLQGGVSEIKVRQAVGRGTRGGWKIPGAKKSFFVVDFRVDGNRILERHVDSRREIYEDMGKVEEY